VTVLLSLPLLLMLLKLAVSRPPPSCPGGASAAEKVDAGRREAGGRCRGRLGCVLEGVRKSLSTLRTRSESPFLQNHLSTLAACGLVGAPVVEVIEVILLPELVEDLARLM